MRAPVYFVRHGQSEWNVLRLTQGQTKHPALTELGRRQALIAAEVVASDLAEASLQAGRILTSDLVRAVQTAEIVGDLIGLVPEEDPRLREQHLGALEAKSYEDSWVQAGLHDWSDPELPIAGGESVAHVRRRLAAVLAAIDPAVPTVLVSHGDAIRSAVAHLLGQSPTDAPWVAVTNGAVARWDGEISWLHTENDTQTPQVRTSQSPQPSE